MILQLSVDTDTHTHSFRKYAVLFIFQNAIHIFKRQLKVVVMVAEVVCEN